MRTRRIEVNRLDNGQAEHEAIDVDLGSLGQIRLDLIRSVAIPGESEIMFRVRFYRQPAKFSYDTGWQIESVVY